MNAKRKPESSRVVVVRDKIDGSDEVMCFGTWMVRDEWGFARTWNIDFAQKFSSIRRCQRERTN